MQTKSYKVFSYPYLASFCNDYKTSKFSLQVEPGRKDDNIAVRLSYSLDNPELEQDILDGKLKVVVRATCNQYSFVKIWEFKQKSTVILECIDPLEVGETISFVGYLMANCDFDLANSDLSDEWAGVISRVQKNNIVGETFEEKIFVKHEGEGKKQSIFNFVCKRDMKDGEAVQMILSEQRIVFCLAKKEFETYKTIQNKSSPIIVSSILVPAFAEILSKMVAVTSPDGEPEPSQFSNEYGQKNWYQVLRARYIQTFKKEPEYGEIDQYKAAQTLLQNPTSLVFRYASESQRRSIKESAYADD